MFKPSIFIYLILLVLTDVTHAYYDPASGRFVNRDSQEEDGGTNLYSFVRNDSVNKTDYLGWEEWDRSNKGEWKLEWEYISSGGCYCVQPVEGLQHINEYVKCGDVTGSAVRVIDVIVVGVKQGDLWQEIRQVDKGLELDEEIEMSVALTKEAEDDAKTACERLSEQTGKKCDTYEEDTFKETYVLVGPAQLYDSPDGMRWTERGR
ncbi:MAG: hypothetical protein H7A51_04990 [Akkermansiaceae bacterium]|nr:hypothetical protein [Akkermansiaceae bacterium]